MSNRVLVVESELTDEGKQMWENIANYEKLAEGQSLLEKEKKKKWKFNLYEMELIFVRTELRKMIKNSERVIRDCENILMFIKDKHEYMQSEAKTAKLVHSNLVTRLQRVLDSMPAFDEDIVVDDEPLRPYADLTKPKKKE